LKKSGYYEKNIDKKAQMSSVSRFYAFLQETFWSSHFNFGFIVRDREPKGKMARLADTLRLLHLTDITKVKIIGDTETLDVELEQDGRRRKAP